MAFLHKASSHLLHTLLDPVTSEVHGTSFLGLLKWLVLATQLWLQPDASLLCADASAEAGDVRIKHLAVWGVGAVTKGTVCFHRRWCLLSFPPAC